MAQRVLVIDSGRRAAVQWKVRLAPLDCVLVGPFSSPSRVPPADLEQIDVVVVESSLFTRGAKQTVSELRDRCEISPALLVLTIAPGDEKQRDAALAAAADEVLEEPIDEPLLTLCIKLLLRVKSARDELVLRTREFLRARDERRMFAESLVHDLKNPIAVAHLNLGWAVERLGSGLPDIVDALSDAQGGLMYLRQMVDDLLLVGILEQSRTSLKREDIRVTELLDQAIKVHEREARARNVSLTRSAGEDVRVMGDSAVLRRAVSNMVETSLRHTPSSGRIALSARTGSGIEIAVSTTGRPLAPEEKAQLIGANTQATPKLLPSGGLALYFCRRAVEAHDGDFDVVENAGGPSSVVMRLPVAG